MTDEPHLRQLIAARHLYFLSDEQIRSELDVAHLAGVNLLHDAVEMALWAAASSTNATRNERTELIQLFDGINGKIGGGLPFRSHLIQLNKLRINAKHYGVRPDISELRRLQSQMLEVMSETALAVFGANFESISLLDLLPADHASTAFLKTANDSFKHGNFSAALIEARKAFFVEFLQTYDVRPWRSKDTQPTGLLGYFGHQAPQWARSATYIEENVRDPIDFIVIDHSELDKNVVQLGLDYNVFWNIWRLTPRVYRPSGDDAAPWVVRDDAFIDENAKGHAEYVLHHLTEILLRVERERQKSKVRGSRYVGLVLTGRGVVMRRKASLDSAVETIPEDVGKVNADYQVDSLDGSGKFWHVSDVLRQPDLRFLVGYIHESDVAAVEEAAIRFPRGIETD
jgi:hypothetical protein